MKTKFYRHSLGDIDIIISILKKLRDLSNSEILVKSLELKNEWTNGDHYNNMMFIALYYEANVRGVETPLKLVEGGLCFDDEFKKYSTMEKLISKGVKIVPKTGALLMPVSKKIAEKINDYNNRSKV